MQYENLKKYIKYRRQQNGLSLNAIAINNDITPAIISRIENLKQDIKMNVLIKIASGFSTTPAQFLLEFEKENFNMVENKK